jgi:hypothetical protein
MAVLKMAEKPVYQMSDCQLLQKAVDRDVSVISHLKVW